MMKLFDKKSHIIFCNEQEALNFSQADNLKDAEKFLKELTDMYIITLGSKGAICFDGTNDHKISGHQVESKRLYWCRRYVPWCFHASIYRC